MSILKKGGTGNPFAASAQSSGGNQQPPRGYQGNNNTGGRGGGGTNPFNSAAGRGNGQGQQYNGNRGNSSGGRGNGQTNNPFATAKGGQGQQVNFQASNHFEPQQSYQSRNHNQQTTGGKPNFNPFASGGGGSVGGSMEMDGGGSNQTSTVFGNQLAPRAQNNGARIGSMNPFAASNQQYSGNMFSSNANNNFGHGPGQAQEFAQFQAQQGFQGGINQQKHNSGFGTQAAPQSGNPFFAGGGRPQPPAAAAPVRAEVNQQAINAVNMSAALAPSQVEELDLGLGGGLLDVAITGAVTGQVHVSPITPRVHSNGASTEGSGEAAVQQGMALLSSILSSCPTSALSEEPPSDDVYKLGGALVAGRVPVVPPARAAASIAGHGTAASLQSNPFSSGGQQRF